MGRAALRFPLFGICISFLSPDDKLFRLVIFGSPKKKEESRDGIADAARPRKLGSADSDGDSSPAEDLDTLVTVRVALPRMGGTMVAESSKLLGKKEVSLRDRKKQEKQVDDDKKKKLADSAEEDCRVQ